MVDRVMLCGAWDEGAGYPRTRSLRQGLEAAGVEVGECRAPAFGRSKQRVLKRPWTWPAAWLRQNRNKKQLLTALDESVARLRPHAVFVPYPGHGLVRAIRERIKVPVVFDMFLSAYDTVVEDRRLVEPGSLLADWLRRVDTEACRAADLILLDTAENAAYVRELTGLDPERFAWLPVHDPDAPAEPAAYRAPSADAPLDVLFFGTGVPLHGLPVLIRAIGSVPGVRLTLVGGSASERALAQRLLGPRLQLEPEFVARERLQQLMAATHLVAGVFGESGKAQRVVPFKVVHALAAGRPVLTGATPAVFHWLDGSGAVWTSPAGDVQTLATQLRLLQRSPDRLVRAAACARASYDQHFATARLAERCRTVLQRLSPHRFSQEVCA